MIFLKVFVVYYETKEKKRGPHIIIINLRTVCCNDVVQLSWKCYIKLLVKGIVTFLSMVVLSG